MTVILHNRQLAVNAIKTCLFYTVRQNKLESFFLAYFIQATTYPNSGTLGYALASTSLKKLTRWVEIL
jgi:hypothetical protein